MGRKRKVESEKYIPTCNHPNCDNALLVLLPTGACQCPVCRCIYRVIMVEYDPDCHMKQFPHKTVK